MTGTVLLVLRILLAIALYTFLLRALYTIWRDLTAQAQQINARQVPVLQVIHLNGPNPTREFHVPEVVIGRDPACELPLSHDTVSSRHARLSYHHNQWWLEDLHSTNGTFLNDERVYTPVVIISGDELRCGKESLTIQILGGE